MCQRGFFSTFREVEMELRRLMKGRGVYRRDNRGKGEHLFIEIWEMVEGGNEGFWGVEDEMVYF